MAGKPQPRDERGWLIPTGNTISYHIYVRMRNGQRACDIAQALGLNRNNVSVMSWAIRHPERKNLLARGYARKRRDAKRMAKDLAEALDTLTS